MPDPTPPKTLRLWPGVVIVVLQLFALYVPAWLAPTSPAMFFGMMGSLIGGTLLVFVWWLFTGTMESDFAWRWSLLVRASAERFEEVARTQVLDGKTWNHPILVDGVVYVRNAEEAAAYRLADPPAG